MTAAGAPIVVETHGLSRRFGRLVAVDAVDLAVGRGEIFGFLGPNGSGKSTFLRMLLGLLRPSAGRARVLGFEMPRDAERVRPRIGYMTQRFSLYDDLSVRENLDFAAAVFGLDRRRRRERVGRAIETDFAGYRDTRAAELSGGFKQRLALAASSIHDPELLVLDEPTAGVDPESRREFWANLFELAGAGATILVSTHYMDEAVRCHRICMLCEGRRAALGAPSALVRALAGRTLEVRAPQAEAALAALHRAPLVASTTQLGASLHVLLARDAPEARAAAGEVQRLLAGAGLRDAVVEPGEPNLEDVFVALLQGERLEAADTPGPDGVTGSGDRPPPEAA